jgi:hypothetical protein
LYLTKEARIKMTNMQRMRNDIATEDKRDIADMAIKDNRVRNDEITADRREVRDGHPRRALAIALLTILALEVGALLFFT